MQELGQEIEGLEALLGEEEEELSQPRPTGLFRTSPMDKEDKLKEKEEALDGVDEKIRQEFRATEDLLRSKGLPDKIIQRHKNFVKAYEEKMRALKQGISRIKKAPSPTKKQEEINSLQEFIQQNKPKPRRHTPLDPNKLPHRRAPKLKPREPRMGMSEEHGARSVELGDWSTEKREDKSFVSCLTSGFCHLTSVVSDLIVSPAYAEEDLPTEADLAQTVEVQFTPEIRDLADMLGNNPVAIYEYVRGLDYEPYYGSLKGAQETLWERAGNDFDLASLLIALYRVSGIPARYCYGTVEIPIEKAMNWVGVEDIKTCGDIFASAGIPAAFGLEGGEIAAIKIEHVYVEAHIPFFPYEGADITQGGEKMWIPVDPSFKQYDYEFTPNTDISNQSVFDIDNYLSDVKFLPPSMEYMMQIREYVQNNMPEETNLTDVLRVGITQREDFGILLGSLPYKTVTTLNKYAEIPDGLRHKIRFEFATTSYTINIANIGTKRITLSYRPATSDDEAVVDLYGGLFETPCYLVNLKSHLKIEGETKATGQEIGMGTSQEFTLEFISPGFPNDRITNEVTAGGYYAIGISGMSVHLNTSSEKVVGLQRLEEQEGILTSNKDDKIGEILAVTTLNYLWQVIESGKMLGRMMHVLPAHQPSEAIASLVLDVNDLYGVPYSIDPVGIAFDVDRYISTPFSIKGDREKEKTFMKLSGLNMSFYEHSILEFGYVE